MKRASRKRRQPLEISRMRTTRATSSSPCVGALLALAIVTAPHGARAQDGAEFYRGRTINLLIGVAVGGSYDRDARLIARHLGSHIPGNPTIVAQNMIGGGGVAMA